MKGKSLRRRQRNFSEAKSGNLLKAQFGKASKWDALPAPPTPEAFKQPVSKRTREVAQFMARKRKRPEVQPDAPQAKRSNNKFKSSSAAEQQTAQGSQAGKEGGDAAAQHEAGAAGCSSKSSAQADKLGPAALQATLQPLKGHGKKTKQKQVLDEKKKLKKLRKQVASMGGAHPKPQARESAFSESDALQREEVAFGDVAHAPPKATLKQRHWDSAQAQDARSSRHAQLMQRQMRKAQAQGRAGSEDGNAAADTRAQAWHREQLQQQVQHAYRQTVKGKPENRADLQSLKLLVAGKA